MDLIPYGVGKPVSLGTLRIANTGTGTATRGNYRYTLRGKRNRLIANGTLDGFPRKRQIAWELVRRVLDDWTTR
ncbi:MAG: hypothetical protein ACREJC_15835 [Tepidisphaeraceae bacterium]